VYFVALARALAAGALGPVYTISRGGAIVAVYPLSVALFGEGVTARSAAGSAVVLAGLVLSGFRTADRRDLAPRALAWAIACAAAIAGYHLAYKAALAAGGAPSAVFALALALATSINAARTPGAAAYARARAGHVLAMGLICGGSFLVLLEALAGSGAGFVLTLRNTSVLFATVLAFAIGERPGRLQLAGAAAVAGGAILMAAA
jgi:drug/metabolite transporter (DMT)-like permease